MILAAYLAVALVFCGLFVIDALEDDDVLSGDEAVLCALTAATWPLYVVVALLVTAVCHEGGADV